MYQNPALSGIKRHARTAVSDVFPHPWRTRQRLGNAVSRPHFEGTLWPNDQSGCRFGLQQGSIVEYCGSHLPIRHNKTGEIVMQPRPYYLSKWYILLAKVAHIQSQPRPYSHVHCSGFHVLYSLARFGLYS